MKYKSPLIEAVFLKRYKRFFADIDLHGEVVVAHVANTGSLKSVNTPGLACLISPADNPERKLRYTLEAIKAPTGAWVGVNTSTPNKIVEESLRLAVQNKVGHWGQFSDVKPEFKLSAETRLDFALLDDKGKARHFIEVKNTTLAEDGVAMFPDAVTERGQKHLRELMALVKEGASAEILFTIQRDDCVKFAPADSIDPEYGRLLREAVAVGVKVSPYVVKITPEEVFLSDQTLPLEL